ncbi:MAG: aspartate aminotransferase family protein [Deltaproteobacteria bacterium]
MNNAALVRAARAVLVGGVDSPVRALAPVPVRRGRGATIVDHDGRRYVDYVLSYGALLLGHADPFVTRRVREAARDGVSFGATTAAEVACARRILRAIPGAQKVRFLSSGTEAVMTALRLARGVTQRRKIIKFDHGYHGHADAVLARMGAGDTSVPMSDGLMADCLKHTLVVRYGDLAALEHLFRWYAGDIAAVIVEPVGGNDGVVPPDTAFLMKLREQTQRYGVLLVFDEVITGFRFRYGAAAQIVGVRPDLICLGKIIGGGLPVGAVTGSAFLMDHLAPVGGVYQASTFGGNPLVTAAGDAALRRIGELRSRYGELSLKAAEVAGALLEEARGRGIGLDVARYASMFSVRFHEPGRFRSFHGHLLRAGVSFAPSEREANFLSFAHTATDIDKTREAVKRAFRRL